MDTHAHAAGPWLVLGVVAVALVGLAAVLLLPRRAAPPEDAAAPDDVAPPGPLDGGYPDDDLPGFLEQPPGSAGARPARYAGPVRPTATAMLSPSPASPCRAPETVDDRIPGRTTDAGSARLLAGLAATALLVIAAAAAVALVAGGSASSAQRPAPGGQGDAPAPVSLGSVPAAPSPGEPGAGTLAYTSVPLGPDGVAARLTFEGVVLEQRAVGSTVAYPSVSVTATPDAALAHLRLPTFNCLADTAPADPAAAGCRRSIPEYAELPSPALSIVRNGAELRLQGRFPTYVRPNGTPPVYTGRVYDLTVTVTAVGRPASGRVRADAVLHLGMDRAGTIDAPGVNVLQYGG